MITEAPGSEGYPPSAKSIEKRSQAPSRPYRWGRFQGWWLVIAGAGMAIATLALAVEPNSTVVRSMSVGFLRATGFGREIKALLEYGNRAGALGMLIAYLLQTVGTGIGLLRKRTFGLFLFLWLAIRAVVSLSPVGVALTLGSLPYYYKRRREFRIP